MSIRLITASAGSGKTTRLSEVLDEAIGRGDVRAEGIIATTFTKQAAAELVERARARLLASGRGREAHQLLAARIGTVNSVCGSLVTDFAFELGLSPALRVLDESSAELEQKRAIASVVDPQLADELYGFRQRFDHELDWHHEVRKLIEAARSNALGPAELARSAARSLAALDDSLGPCEADGAAIDADLLAAIDHARAAIHPSIDKTKVTAKYLDDLESIRRNLVDERLRWGDWAKLCSDAPGAKSAAAVAPIQRAAQRHRAHPRLRAELHRLVDMLFRIASDALGAYQDYKRERGIIDFVDQEALALQLLRRPDVRTALAGQLDLVLVDEFQDTSPLQLAIFLELASLARESVWVGDQKQAIYGFRGTDPALMDAVIESLTQTSTDPELVRSAVEAIHATSTFETLSTSYRSRPALVELTSDLFARAFAHHGMPEDRTRLAPASPDEPPGLGPIVEHWPLRFPRRMNKDVLASAAAAGVRDLLARQPLIRDPQQPPPATRAACPRDIAVLCRTNEQCQLIANALAELDIPAVVPRMRLLDTAEGRIVMAGLRLWADPRDGVAAAELARIVTYATNLDALVERALTSPPGTAFDDDPLVTALLEARASRPDLDPIATLCAVIDATKLRELCAAWGHVAQRLANLDALRAHAVTYVDECTSSRDATSLLGLLAYLDDMTVEWGWSTSRSDHQALLGGTDAITVSTWHAAKGREWPITILYGLESLREPTAFGLHVESDVERFDMNAPLAGRWLRYWPNPYTTFNQRGPVKEAYEASPAFAKVVARTQREVLRLLYVGWTRARDRLVLAAAPGKLEDGLLGALTQLDPSLFGEPPGDADAPPHDVDVSWAGRTVAVHVRSFIGIEAVPPTVVPGEVTVGRPTIEYVAARCSPSAADPVPCDVGEPIVLGPRLPLRGSPDMEQLGNAVHAFLAIDDVSQPAEQRREAAIRLLHSHGVDGHLDAGDLVGASERLWSWLERDATPLRVRRELPIAHRLPSGTVVSGTADLVARTLAGLVLVDHKSLRGSTEHVLNRVREFSGQLAMYADALTAATGGTVATFIHLPLLGLVVPLVTAQLTTEHEEPREL